LAQKQWKAEKPALISRYRYKELDLDLKQKPSKWRLEETTEQTPNTHYKKKKKKRFSDTGIWGIFGQKNAPNDLAKLY
jgi:hypothetical protein